MQVGPPEMVTDESRAELRGEMEVALREIVPRAGGAGRETARAFLALLDAPKPVELSTVLALLRDLEAELTAAFRRPPP